MKIVAIIDSLRGGGAERIFSFLTHEWAKAGHSVAVFTLKPDAASELSHPNLVVRSLRNAPATGLRKLFALPALIRSIRRAARDERPNVIVSFMDQANILTLLATHALPVPVIIAERIYPAYSSLLASARFSMTRRFYRWLRNLSYQKAASIVLQSDRSISYFPAKLQRKICVIPNPIIPPRDAGFAVEIPRPTVLALGRLTKQKRFDRAISAFAEVASDFPEWHLLIVGTGPELDALQTLAESKSCARRIHFLGYQGNTASLFSQSSVFLLSSDYEGSPVALGEALSSGVPAIATDCLTGPRELLGNSEFGVLVPDGDQQALGKALRAMIASNSERERFATLGKKRAEEFAPSRVLPLWQAHIEEIANNTSHVE